MSSETLTYQTYVVQCDQVFSRTNSSVVHMMFNIIILFTGKSWLKIIE